MEKEEVLKIEFAPVFDKWAWRIVYQNEEVLKRGEFEDKIIGVFAIVAPNYQSHNKKLFVFGDVAVYDDNINICTTEEKAEIEAKVKAVNEKYGVVKRWRAEKDGVYWIALYRDGKYIPNSAHDNSKWDTDKWERGNYFQTEEQCQKACDEINAIFEKNKQGGFE